jgi:hypothetical protein
MFGRGDQAFVVLEDGNVRKLTLPRAKIPGDEHKRPLLPKLVAALVAGSYPELMKTPATRGTHKRGRVMASPLWSEEDDRALEKLLKNGVDRDTIMKSLGRSQADVVWRIAELRSGRG